MYKSISLIMTLSLFLTSCCSITQNRLGRVTVTSRQKDAGIFIDGYHYGTAPITVNLDKTQDHLIVATKSGYQDQQIYVQSKRTAKSAYNLLMPVAGAGIGTVVGLATFGTTAYCLPFFIAGTAIGGLIGLGVGTAGAATDIYRRSDCELNRKVVHFDLTQTY